MAQNLYALLVGINDYDPNSNVKPLRGCVNDIEAMAAYLQGRLQSDGFELHLQVLTNEQATRDRIIQGFQHHLAQAGSNDVALFYYAGHGAQATAPEIFWPSEPDHLLETLVCYDSRTDNCWDLADEELAQLIANLGKNDPHIAIILDCCHSGSGTREGEEPIVATRRAEQDKRSRPLDSFILSIEEIDAQNQAAQQPTPRSLEPVPAAIHFPQGRHVVLSACRDIEEAKEYNDGDTHRGAFSYFLMESLQKASNGLTYRDLFKRANALVRNRVSSQSPQMEATQIEDLEQPFLGGAIAPAPPYFTVSYDRDRGWVIDGGAIHGIPTSSHDGKVRLALFAFDSPNEVLTQPSDAIAEAEVTAVLPQLSQIQFTKGADLAAPTETFKAIITQIPLPTLTVDLSPLPALEQEAVQQAIATAGPDGQASLYIRALLPDQSDTSGDFSLSYDGAQYQLLRYGEAKVSAPYRDLYTAHSPRNAVERLEHMARWTTVAMLDSPANSRIAGAVQMQIYSGEGSKETAVEIQNDQLRLHYQKNTPTDSPTPPSFRVKFKNISDQTLFCALFDLTERYKVRSVLPGGGVVRLAAGQETWLADGRSLKGSIPPDLLRQQVSEYRDTLKLVACTAEFDPTLMNQPELGQPLPSATRSASRGKGTLNRLMKRVITRDIGWAAEEEEQYDDWITNQVTFTFVYPADA